MSETNKYWQRYEKGYDYIMSRQLLTKTQRNWNFYTGRQWEGIQAGGEDLPMLNFIKRMVKHKVSTVSQNNMVVHYSDMQGRDGMEEVYEKLELKFSEIWEKANLDQELWKITNDAAVTGDGIMYFASSDPSDAERIPNTSVLYGDESKEDIQKQPYIILHQRLSMAEVRQIGEENGVDPKELALIKPDDETQKLIGNQQEIDYDKDSDNAKVTCIIHLEKKDGVVHITRATKQCVFEPERPITALNPDGTVKKGLNLYPIVRMTWENFPNDARGVGEVEQLIPNQLEINKTLARMSLINKMTAYPRVAYDANALANPDALNEVGTPLEMTSGGVQSVGQLISYLEPAQISPEPRNFLEGLLSNTQELGGAGETAMGNINPSRVAASAIIAIRDQAALPLNEQVEKRNTFVEDLAKLVIEMVAVYEPNGFDVLKREEDPLTGEETRTVMRVSGDDLRDLEPTVRIDTSQDNPWTKEAEQNWLDGVLDKQHITFEEYIDASPEHGIIPKNKMEQILEKRKAKEAAMMQQQQALQQQQAELEQEMAARGIDQPE